MSFLPKGFQKAYVPFVGRTDALWRTGRPTVTEALTRGLVGDCRG